jgi:hypothetical protein
MNKGGNGTRDTFGSTNSGKKEIQDGSGNMSGTSSGGESVRIVSRKGSVNRIVSRKKRERKPEKKHKQERKRKQEEERKRNQECEEEKRQVRDTSKYTDRVRTEIKTEAGTDTSSRKNLIAVRRSDSKRSRSFKTGKRRAVFTCTVCTEWFLLIS